MANNTKNRQSDETIILMAKKAFPQKEIIKIKELTEGMCNVTYDIAFADGSESILKVAAKDRSGNTSNEIDLMKAEVLAMKEVSEKSSVKLANVQYYDCSREICDGDYFFMEKLRGENYIFIKDRLSEEVNRQISEEMGAIALELSHIRNDQFGFMGDNRRFDNLYEFVYFMLTNLISDAQRRQIDPACDPIALLEQLENEKMIFDEVQTASLVHWDMWEGNIFVENGHVSGVIDWERALWGEAFMDDRFRFHNMNQDFLKGFGKSSFTETEKKRLRWYDIILYLTMMIEVYYREYEDKGQYDWAKEMLEKVL